jgi:uncharacterized protein YtpQ (UPF0354 family)
MDADAFTLHYTAAVSATLPDADITTEGPLRLTVRSAAGPELQVFLDNPYADYCRDPDDLEGIVEDHIYSIRETIDRYLAERGVVDMELVLPLIRTRNWLDNYNSRLTEAGASPGSHNFHRDFAGDFVIVYAVDRPTTIQYLTHFALEKRDLSPDALHERAVENLARRLPNFRIQTFVGGNVAMLEAGKEFESSLLLLDGIWSHEALQFGGDVVVAAPARSILLVTGADNAAGLAQMRRMVVQVMADDTYPLSDVLLVRRNGRFERFDE